MISDNGITLSDEAERRRWLCDIVSWGNIQALEPARRYVFVPLHDRLHSNTLSADEALKWLKKAESACTAKPMSSAQLSMLLFTIIASAMGVIPTVIIAVCVLIQPH